MKKHLYMEITKDKYELPLAVAETIPELARITGKSSSGIRNAFHRAKTTGCKIQYIKIEMDGDDEKHEVYGK